MSLSSSERETLQDVAAKVAAIRSSASFLKYMWSDLTGGRPLEWGRHIQVICDALDRLHRGEVKGNILVINIPPRHLKSTTVSVAHPAWVWLQKPYEQFLSLSCIDTVATRDAREMRRLVESPKYQELVRLKAQLDAAREKREVREADIWTISDDNNTKTEFGNSRVGHRIARPAGANITGVGGDTIIIDDPLDAKTILKSPGALRDLLLEVQDNYENAWKSRRNDGERSRIVLIMQRLHEMDLAGYILESEPFAREEAVILPTEFDPEIACRFDWRQTRGELLLPERVNREFVDSYKKKRPLDFAAQHGQRPTPGSGGKFDLDNWRHYAGHPIDAAEALRNQGGSILISVDCASKKGSENDFTSIDVLGAVPADAPKPPTAPTGTLPAGSPFPPRARVLFDNTYERLEIDELVRTILGVVRDWPWARKLLIEDASNGIAAIQILQNLPTSDGPFLDDAGRPIGFPHHRVQIVPMRPGASKETRADFTASYQRIGLVFLPEAADFSYAIKDQHLRFPRGAHDDHVDSLSQAMVYLEDPENVPRTATQTLHALSFLSTMEKDSHMGLPFAF